MNKYQIFGKKAEQIVSELLKNKKTKGEIEKKRGRGIHGDFHIGKKTIEVKGWWTDEDTKSEKDYPCRTVKISGAEYEQLQNDPKNFELQAVYRLDREHKTNKGHPVRYTVMPGEVLKECKAQSVTLRVPEKVWQDPRVTQKDLPTNLKKKFGLNKNEK